MKIHRVSQLRWLLPASLGLCACYGRSAEVVTQDQVVHLEEQALVGAPATPAASESDGDDGGVFDGSGDGDGGSPSISVDATGGDAVDAEVPRPDQAAPMPDAFPDEDPLGREEEGFTPDLGGVGSAGGDLDTGTSSPAGSTPIDDEVFGGGGAVTFIRLDPGQRFQTMDGWEATDYAAQIDSPAWEKYKNELFDLAVNDLGITRIRLEVRAGVENTRDYWQEWQDGLIEYVEYRSNRYVTVNDNDDPDVLDLGGFHFSEMDHNIREVLLPLKELVEANGEEFFINVCYVAFTGQNPAGAAYHHNLKTEYGEFALATHLHLRDSWGLRPDSWEVILEPDNVPEWGGAYLGRVMVHTADLLEQNGFAADFVAPSTASLGGALNFFDRMSEVAGALDNLFEYSYHRYFGATEGNLEDVADRAAQYGKRTAHLELIGANHEDLHQDLKTVNNSAWAQYTLATSAQNGDDGGAYYLVDDSDPLDPVIIPGVRTRYLRQYMKFIRPGATRIQADTTNPALDPVAFIGKDGSHTVVIKAEEAGTFFIPGMPSGRYGVKFTTNSMYDIDLPDVYIPDGGTVGGSIPGYGVVTVYSK